VLKLGLLFGKILVVLFGVHFVMSLESSSFEQTFLPSHFSDNTLAFLFPFHLCAILYRVDAAEIGCPRVEEG